MNIYQWYNKEEKPKIIKECMDQVKFQAGEAEYILIAPEHKKFDACVGVRSESDVLRCTLLSEDPEGCWLDTDCEIVKKFVPPADGKPYFSQGIRGRANGDVIIANGNTKVFKDLLADFSRLPENQRNPGWMQAWLRVNQDRIGLIPYGYYRHFCLCHTGHLTPGQTMSVNGAVLKMDLDGQISVISRD